MRKNTTLPVISLGKPSYQLCAGLSLAGDGGARQPESGTRLERIAVLSSCFGQRGFASAIASPLRTVLPLRKSVTAAIRSWRLEQFEQELISLLPRLRRFARSLTKDAFAADDLCQMAIERALKRRSQHRPDARLDSWMFTIMRNCWLDEVRSQRRWSDHFELGDDAGADRAVSPGDVLAGMSLNQAMNELPLEQREAVALAWVEGLSYREASEVLEVPIGTLTSRLARARQRLISTLEAA